MISPTLGESVQSEAQVAEPEDHHGTLRGVLHVGMKSPSEEEHDDDCSMYTTIADKLNDADQDGGISLVDLTAWHRNSFKTGNDKVVRRGTLPKAVASAGRISQMR